MPAQQRYIRSILSTFATFLANADVGQLAKETGIPETRLNIAVQELLVEFLRWKNEYLTWSSEEIEQFSQESSLSAIQLTTLPLLIQFVNEYPPHQTNVFLQEFLLALKKDGCSNSTVKNYRSDISQFIEFCDENEIESLLTKTKLSNFYRFQKENKLKDSTIKRKMSSIVQFGIWMKTEGILAEAPSWLKAGFVFQPSAPLLPQDEAKLRTSLAKERFENNYKSQKNLTTSSLTKTLTTAPGKRNLLSLARLPVSSIESSPASGSPLKHQEKRAQLKSSLGGLSELIRTRVADTFEQVKQKASLNILPYINLALIALFFLGLGSLGYSQLITNAPFNFAYSTQPTPPGRTLSFQGRLTDQGQNPITSNTPMTFRLYKDITGGTALWTSSGCSVEPDQDGIFAVGLGDLAECGPAIDPSVFSENPNIWLEVQVDTETLAPRQAIRTVAYALNAETLQGYPLAPTGGAEANTVVTMNNDSVVLFSEAVVLQTAAGTNADIKLAADGTGLINLDDLFYVSSSAGGVGIGTTNPGSAMLAVMTGNVGIGTTSPSALLHVAGTFSLNSGAIVDNIRTAIRAVGVADDESLVTEAAIASAIGTSQSKWNVTSGYLTPNSSFADNVAVPSGKFAVGYGSVGATGVAAFSGNVGIGTTSPASIFQINGGVGTLATGFTLGDGDTGFFEAADDDIRFVTGGTSRFRLATNFGSTTTGGPWMIDSVSTATAPIFTPNNDSNTGLGFAGADIVSLIAGGTNGLNVISSGNVGVGTTSPTGKLNVTRSTTGVLLRLDGNSQSGNLIEAGYANSGDHFRVTNAGTIFVQPPSGGNNLIQLRENTAQASMVRFEDGSTNILGTINRATTSDRLGLRLYNTLETTASNYERLSIYPDPVNNIFRIDVERGGTGVLRNLVLQGGGGNVGIGTTSPAYRLDVVSGASVAARFDGRVIGSDAVADTEFVTLGQLSAGTGQYWQRNSTVLSPSIITDAVSVGSTTPASAMFYVPGTTNNNAWFNLGTGNVGIGTTGPIRPLHIHHTGADTNVLWLDAGSSSLNNAMAFVVVTPNTGAQKALGFFRQGESMAFASFEGALGGAGKAGFALGPGGSSARDTNLYRDAATTLRTNSTMIIDGNVGIGNTAPIGKLEVSGGNADTTTPQLILSGGKTGTVGDLYILDSQNNNLGVGYAAKVVGVNIQNQVNANNQVLQRTTSGGITGSAAFYLGADDLNQGGFGILTAPQGSSAGTVLTERLTVRGNGNVGIGTTNPISKFEVYGQQLTIGRDANNRVDTISFVTTDNSQRNVINAYGSTTVSTDYLELKSLFGQLIFTANNSEAMRIDRSGNVGIGVTNPASILNVGQSYSGSGYVHLAPDISSTTYSATDVFTRAPWDTVSIGYRAETNYKLAGIKFLTVTGTSTRGARIIHSSEDATGLTAGLHFQVGSGTLTQTMIMKNDGNVGIGTTNPTAKLDVGTGTAVTLKLANPASGNPTMEIGRVSSQPSIKSTDAHLIMDSLSNYASINHYVNQHVVLALGGGNVGIGNNSPTQRLDVSGNVRFSGALMPNNAAGTSGQFLISAGAGNPPTWTSTVPATSLKWNALTNPDGNLSLGMGTYTTTFNWATGTGANNLFNLTTDSSNGTGSLLNIQTQGTTMSPLRVRVGSNEALFVSGGGNVGVGTTSPEYKLEVQNSLANIPTLAIGTTPDQNIVLDSVLGQLVFTADDDSSGSVKQISGSIKNVAYGLNSPVRWDGSTSSEMAGLAFYYLYARGDLREALRIDNRGNVGIGTTSPQATLDVGGQLHNVLRIATNTSNTGSATLRLDGQGTAERSWYLRSDGITTGNYGLNFEFGLSSGSHDSAHINFKTRADQPVRLHIANNGNIGIGTTNPSELLTLGVTSDGSATSRKSIQFNNGGWAAPGATTATSNGDKLILYKSATEAYKIGLESSNIWLQSHAGIKIYNSSATQTANIAVGSGNSWFNTGNLGIGTSGPAERLHVYDDTGITAYTTTNSGNGNLIVQSAYGGRTVGTGAALAFSIPANTDGTNFWDQGRILTTPDNNSNGSASGRMYLQTRYYTGSAWSWRDNLVLRSNGNVGVGTTTPSSTLHVNGDFRLASGTNVNNIVTTLGNPGSDNNLVTEAAIRTAINTAVATESSFAVVAGNWYTIATNPGNRAYATFEVWDTESGRHASMQFNAGISYNSVGVITMLGKSWYSSGGGIFNNIRIRRATVYDPQYLQVYATANGTLRVRMHNNIQTAGWTLTSDGAPTGNPATTTAAEVDPNEANGLATSGGGYFGNNVGIGVTNPSATLQVAGSARIDNYLGVGVAPDSTYRIYANGAAYGIRAHGSTMGGRFEDSDSTSVVYAAYGTYGIYQGTGVRNYFAGNIGIGSLTPEAKLNVIGTTAGDGTWKEGIVIENTNATAGEPALSFKNSATGSNYWITGLNQGAHYDIAYGTTFAGANTLLRIQSNDGNVGIGTITPTKKLHVNGDIRANVYFDTTGSDEYYLDLNNSGRAFSLLGSASIGGYSVNTATTKLSVMGGNVGIGTTNANTSLTIYNQHAMALSAGGDIGAYGAPAGSYPLRLFESFGWNFTVQNLADSGFRIHPPENTAYTNTPYFVVKYGGNVGIRINNPEAPIHTIAYTTGDQALFQKWSYSNAAPDQYRLNLKQTVTSGVVRYTFDLRNNNTNYDNMLTFDRGNVGIGVTSPGYKLDVSGTAHITGLSTLDSNLVFTQGSSARNIGVVGTYSPNSLASIWSMGAAYQLTSAGGAGNLYGLSYSYEPNYRGAGNNPGAIAGLGHQMQWRANGTTQTAIGTGIYTIGNVGIGTTASRGKLDIGAAGDAYLTHNTLQSGNNSLFLPGHIFMAPFSTGDIVYLQARRSDSSGSTSLRLRTYNAGTLVETMHLASNGNVGIGTTNPGNRLDVASGSVRVQSIANCATVGTSGNGDLECRYIGLPTITGGRSSYTSNDLCHPSYVNSYCRGSLFEIADRNTNSGWYPADFNVYTQLDFGQRFNATSTVPASIRVMLNWDTAYGTCGLDVSTSLDGTTWTTILDNYALSTAYNLTWFTTTTTTSFRYLRVGAGSTVGGDSCGWLGVMEIGAGGNSYADLAERYLTTETLTSGNIVSIKRQGGDKYEVTKEHMDPSQILGIITTSPHTLMGYSTQELGKEPADVALAGRVPAIVTTLDGQLLNGDRITSSTIAGLGAKATKAGETVGKTLESTSHWNENNCPIALSIDTINWPQDDGTNQAKPCYRVPISSLDSLSQTKLAQEYGLEASDFFYVGKVMTFVNVSWYDPDVYLESVGGINQLSSAPTSSSLLEEDILETLDYSVRDASTNTAVTRLGNFAEVAIGKINAGLTKTSSLIAENAVVTRAKIADLSTSTLQATKATIDELTTRSIKLGNFELKEVGGKLQIINQNSQTVATIDQDGNTIIEGELTTTAVTSTKPIENTTSLLGELIAQDVHTTNLTATGSTQLAELMTDSVETDSLTVTGTSQLGELIATNIETEAVETNSLIASNLEVTNQLTAQNSRFEQLEAKIAELDEIKATTARIVNGEFETVTTNSLAGNNLNFDQATIKDVTVSGSLYADVIVGFEEKVAQAFRQPSLLGSLLGSGADYDQQQQELVEIIESAGYTATNSNQLRQSLADLNLGADDVVITPAAAFVNRYLEVNGSAYIADSLAVNNYLVMGDGLKMAATSGMASIDYVSSSNPTASTLYLQSSGIGRIDLMAGLMTIDSSGSVIINGDIWIAGNVGIDGALSTNTLLTNLIESNDYDRPTQIRLGAYVDENGNTIYGEVAGDSTENTQLKQSRLEIIDERGAAVATISATGRAEFADGLGIGTEDLSGESGQEETSVTHKTSGRAKIESGQKQIIIRSSKVSTNSQIFVTPLGSTNNQVLYVKSQVADDPSTIDVEGLFIVGFDAPASNDVLFNWWIVN